MTASRKPGPSLFPPGRLGAAPDESGPAASPCAPGEGWPTHPPRTPEEGGSEDPPRAPGERPQGGRGAESATAALRPLDAGERPTPLLIAVAVASILGAGIAVSVATVHDLRRHGGSVPGGTFLAIVLMALAWGMYRKRYWAVLGFEALLAFQIIVTSLALVVASTLLAGAICLLAIGLGGWLFWKLVRVMGRIQAGERRTPDS